MTPTITSESILTSAIRQVDQANHLTSSDTLNRATHQAVESGDFSNHPGFLPGQQGVIRGSLPGVAGVSFIRTTPMMSPPPGTTGYTPPTSLGLSTFRQSFNQFSNTPESSAVTPSTEFRQPQRPDNVLPGENAYQLPSPGSITAPVGATTSPEVNLPTNNWDSFWGGS